MVMGRGSGGSDDLFDGVEPVVSYGRGQALADGVVSAHENVSVPDAPPRFSAGRTAVTPGAAEELGRVGMTADQLLNRHIVGDWGECDPDDAKANEDALRHGSRILSVYRVEGTTFYIITDAATKACYDCHEFYDGRPSADCSYCHGSSWGEKDQRLTTTVMLPSEY